jgi:hypothetical protein
MTAGAAPPIPITFTAVGTINKYRFVKFSAANSVEECDTQGEAAMGVAVEAQTDGEAVSVWPLGKGGIIPVEASASITVLDEITTGTAGKAEAGAAGDILLGVVVEAASGDLHVVGFVPEYAARVHA